MLRDGEFGGDGMDLGSSDDATGDGLIEITPWPAGGMGISYDVATWIASWLRYPSILPSLAQDANAKYVSSHRLSRLPALAIRLGGKSSSRCSERAILTLPSIPYFPLHLPVCSSIAYVNAMSAKLTTSRTPTSMVLM